MKKQWMSLVAAILMAGAMPAFAQYGQYDPPTQQDNSNSPSDSDSGPGVARLSFIHGDVSSQRGDNGSWVAATLNTPVSVDDRISTGDDARAEVQLDYANVLRMSGHSTAKIAGLSRSNIQVQVGQGLVTYSVLNGAEANAEIDTPNAAVHPQGPGDFRILVNSDSETEVIARRGSADISTPQGTTHINAGDMITVEGTDNPEYKITAASGRDDWDSWNDDRDRRISSAQSWHKTNRYYTGSEDLDAYGRWSDVPDYGPVWIPNTGPGWVPYSDGRWVWEPYYGWTWVSYEPWGWAPYHYGRWFVYGGNWVWWPGPVYAYPAYYPVWAPAYVSFFGWGGGGWGVSFGFGFGFGHVGWLPCGPGDWYHPWWGRWGGRYNTINVTNIRNTTIINNYHDGFRPIGPRGRGFSNVDEAFRNERVRGGMTSMDSNRFGRDPVRGRGPAMNEATFRQASMVNGKMPFTPSRESFSPSGREANPSSFRSAPPTSQRFFGSAPRNSNTGANVRSVAGASGGGRQPLGGNRNASSFQEPQQPAISNPANARGPVQSSRPGWRTFTPPQSVAANRAPQGFRGNGGASANNSSRGTFTPPSRPAGQGAFQAQNRGAQPDNRGSWQHFTPPAQSSQPQGFNRGSGPSNQSQRPFNPPSSASRGNSYNSYSRSPLNMRQPIVTPRGGGYYGNGRSRSYPSGSSPAYSAPRGGGGYSAPRGGGGYSGPRGGGYSAPRGGGGGGNYHSGGGGGRSGGNRGR